MALVVALPHQASNTVKEGTPLVHKTYGPGPHIINGAKSKDFQK